MKADVSGRKKWSPKKASSGDFLRNHLPSPSRDSTTQPTPSADERQGPKAVSRERDRQRPRPIGPEHGDRFARVAVHKLCARDSVEEHLERDASLESRQ